MGNKALGVLADSSNGYTIDFDVYIGKDAGRFVSDKGLAYDVVMKLMQPYLHQGYHLFFDNCYTSIARVNDLFELSVPSAGTVRVNRKGFPDSLKDVKIWARRLEKGSMRWERVPPLLVLQYSISFIFAGDIASISRYVPAHYIWLSGVITVNIRVIISSIIPFVW